MGNINNNTSPRGIVVRNYLTEYPQLPTRTLASLIYKKESDLFDDYEQVRSFVRYYRGKSGADARNRVGTKEFFFVTDEHNPFNLPEPVVDKDVLPYEFPDEYKSTLVISDLHIPFHDIPSINVALEYAQNANIDSILFAGDIFDFFAVSYFKKDPRKRDLAMEIEIGRQFFDDIDKHFPPDKVKKFFKWGNHEERWQSYLWLKAPELVGVPMFDLEDIYEFEKHNMETILGRSEILVGDKLTIVHGHEFQSSAYSPVNPARGFYIRFEDNIIGGHFHRPSHHSQKQGRGSVKSAWSLGCNCSLRPEYATLNKWIHGFGHLSRESRDQFHFRNFAVIDGKLYEA